VTHRLTPGHFTHSNFIYRMRGYCTTKDISKRPVRLWAHPTTHWTNTQVSSLGDKAEGLPGWPLIFIEG
jgi:hypothetical protein